MAAAAAQIPWGHNMLLLDRLEGRDTTSSGISIKQLKMDGVEVHSKHGRI